MLYNIKGEVPDGEHVVPIGKADTKRPGTDVTLVCHSKTLTVALKAAEQLAAQNISAEVLDLRSLRPLDESAILESVRKTNRAVVVEEGWPHAGIGAQIVDLIQRDAFDDLDAPVQRVTQADVPMPYNKLLERAAKASPERVVAAARRSEEHTSELQSRLVISYAVFCLKKKKQNHPKTAPTTQNLKKNNKNKQ